MSQLALTWSAINICSSWLKNRRKLHNMREKKTYTSIHIYRCLSFLQRKEIYSKLFNWQVTLSGSQVLVVQHIRQRKRLHWSATKCLMCTSTYNNRRPTLSLIYLIEIFKSIQVYFIFLDIDQTSMKIIRKSGTLSL